MGWAEDKGEVQIMDLLLQMKQKTAELRLMKKPQLRKRVILQMEHLKGETTKIQFADASHITFICEAQYSASIFSPQYSAWPQSEKI